MYKLNYKLSDENLKKSYEHTFLKTVSKFKIST